MNYQSFTIIVSEEGHNIDFRIYESKTGMRQAYKELSPEQGEHDEVESVHCAYTFFDEYDDGSKEYSKHTGILLTHSEEMMAGVIEHELMHAIFWAHKHHADKEQYPIIITNMEEEEILLGNFTHALNQLYTCLSQPKLIND